MIAEGRLRWHIHVSDLSVAVVSCCEVLVLRGTRRDAVKPRPDPRSAFVVR